MKNWKKYDLTVNGLVEHTVYNEATIENLFIPMLERWTSLWEKKKKRLIVFMAAPPAVGKTTLSLFLEALSQKTTGVHDIQAIGLDGFHYHADYIAGHTVLRDGKAIPMQAVKGCPETFNVAHLREKLQRIRTQNILWPIYDRTIHDVIEDQVEVTGDIVLIEGNWLLLKDAEWRDLRACCDDAVMITADEEMLKHRLIARKVQGGARREAAEAFYEKSDGPNVTRVLRDSQSADLVLRLTEDNDYERVN